MRRHQSRSNRIEARTSRSGIRTEQVPAAAVAVRGQAGVTAIELAVVLVIVGILAVVVLSASGLLKSALIGAATKGAADQLAAGIRQARQRAITAAQDHCIQLVNATPATFQMFTGGRSGNTCSGTAAPDYPAPVELIHQATIDSPRAFRFTPVSTVDPVGPTLVTIQVATCTTVLTVTAEGGVLLPGTDC